MRAVFKEQPPGSAHHQAPPPPCTTPPPRARCAVLLALGLGHALLPRAPVLVAPGLGLARAAFVDRRLCDTAAAWRALALSLVGVFGVRSQVLLRDDSGRALGQAAQRQLFFAAGFFGAGVVDAFGRLRRAPAGVCALPDFCPGVLHLQAADLAGRGSPWCCVVEGRGAAGAARAPTAAARWRGGACCG